MYLPWVVDFHLKECLRTLYHDESLLSDLPVVDGCDKYLWILHSKYPVFVSSLNASHHAVCVLDGSLTYHSPSKDK